MDNSNKENVVFDLCDTLFYSNTTYDFIYFVLKRKNKIKLKVFNRLLSRRSPHFIFYSVIQKIFGKDYIKRRSVSLLKGFTKDELEQLGNCFYEEVLEVRKIEQTHILLSSIKKAGSRVWIASSSLEPIVSAVAKRLNVEYVASSLEFNNNVATGNIANEITGKKDLRLSEIIGLEVFPFMVVTDNLSDYNLLRLASVKKIIIYGLNQMKNWMITDAEYIRLSKKPYYYESED